MLWTCCSCGCGQFPILFGYLDDCSDCGRTRCPNCAMGRLPKKPLKRDRVEVFVRRGKLRKLKLLIHNIEVTAIPDTGASINAVSLDTLGQLQISTDRHNGESYPLRTARGAYLKALYQIMLPCRLPTTSRRAQTFHVRFHVFSKLPAGIGAIMGCEFLKTTEILTKRSYLLKERHRLQGIVPTCMSIRSEQAPFVCRGFNLTLSGATALTSSDTGSEINLISGGFVKTHKVRILKVAKLDNIHHVEFADGEIVRVTKKVIVPWELPGSANDVFQKHQDKDRNGTKFPAQGRVQITDAEARLLSTFYIVEGLVYDVILGQPALDALDAFGRRLCAIEPAKLAECHTLCTIFKSAKKRKTTTRGQICSAVGGVEQSSQEERKRR